LLDDRHILQGLDEPIQDGPSAIHADHLAPPEHHGDLGLVPLAEEALGVAGLELEIVLLGLRSELDFFELDNRLFLARFPRLFGLLVPVLAVVHDPADRRPSFRRHLHQIEL
jgi:hypothetical protein